MILLVQVSRVIFLFSIVCLSIVALPSTMFYRVLLLLFRLRLLYFLSSSYCVSVLFYLLVCIIYIGAMMVLIGYICAVRPNVSLEVRPSFRLTAFLMLLTVLYATGKVNQPLTAPLSSLREYFYSSFGAPVFFILIFSLFFTLLIVTSYYLSRKGPFRSVSV